MTAVYRLSQTARDLVGRVARDKGAPLCMVIANGCCDGTAPYLYANMTPEPHWTLIMEDDLVSVYSGNLGPDVPGMDVVIDARRDMSDSLSLESDYGYRFVIRFVESGKTMR